MGKSYKHNKSQYNENKSNSEFKHRKNKVRDTHEKEELSEFKIHGFKHKSPN